MYCFSVFNIYKCFINIFLKPMYCVQVILGMFQATGWPGVVSVMANWFGKGRRGLIMGLWNSHTSLGNILGSLIAGAFLSSSWNNWGLSFIVPGAIIAGVGFLLFLFLVPKPGDIGLSDPVAGTAREQASASKSSIRRFVITEKAPTRAFSWLKAATTAFTFKTLL